LHANVLVKAVHATGTAKPVRIITKESAHVQAAAKLVMKTKLKKGELNRNYGKSILSISLGFLAKPYVFSLVLFTNITILALVF
jgi:hypothetical protein